jgi:flagellar basal body rod protein FlgG
MIQGIYQSAAAADGLQTWNDVIARNITSSGSAGFRRGMVVFDGVLNGVMSYGTNPARPVEQAVLSPLARDAVNFKNGDLLPSASPFDFAIAGNGFFRAQAPDGTMIYTRDGQFRVGPDGQLQNKLGYPIMGESGPIQLLIDGGNPTVDADGRVRQGDQEVGVITVYEVPDIRSLVRTDGGFALDPASPQSPRAVEGGRVRQNFTEMSNVSPMLEMAELITVSNALQANQKVIQTFDGLAESAIRQLAAPV